MKSVNSAQESEAATSVNTVHSARFQIRDMTLFPEPSFFFFPPAYASFICFLTSKGEYFHLLIAIWLTKESEK